MRWDDQIWWRDISEPSLYPLWHIKTSHDDRVDWETCSTLYNLFLSVHTIIYILPSAKKFRNLICLGILCAVHHLMWPFFDGPKQRNEEKRRLAKERRQGLMSFRSAEGYSSPWNSFNALANGQKGWMVEGGGVGSGEIDSDLLRKHGN